MLRRRFLAAAGAAALWRPSSAWAVEPWQPPEPFHRAFMARAIQLANTGTARGEGTPYGAVVVRRGRIIGEGWNRSAVKGDPTAHAEIEAIQDAARRLGRRDLAGCVMYASGGRPCPMCEGGAYFASIDRIYHAHDAGDITDAGPPQIMYCR